MNREIKFRGLYETNNGERSWYYYGVGSKPHLFGGYHWLIEDLEFTGLHDSNRKEVYEGDILKYCCINGGRQVFISVKWNDARFEGRDTVDNEEYLVCNTNISQSEVIGNIYENKELLK